MFRNWRIVWTTQKRNTLLLALAIVIIFSGLLGLATGMFFYQQQQIYTSVRADWETTEEYYEFLDQNKVEEDLVVDFGQITSEDLTELDRLKTDYGSLVGSIANDLTHEEPPQNPIAQDFYDASREVLILEQRVAEESFKLVEVKHCLSQTAARQTEINVELAEVFDNLGRAESTGEVKKWLTESVDLTEQKTQVSQESADCFLGFGETEKETASSYVEPLQKSNLAYKEAVEDFFEGIDKLEVKQTEEALKSIKLNQVSPEALQGFDTFIKIRLEDQYTRLVGERRALDDRYQALRQSYLEIRLRTLFK